MRAREHGGAEIPGGIDRESGSDPSSGTSPTRGVRLAVRQGGEGDAGPDWARSGERAGGVKKKRERWAGLKERLRKKGFPFSKTIQTLSN